MAAITDEQVEQMILSALSELNEERPEDERFVVGPEVVLFGPGAEIDSLSLVSLIVDVETALNIDFDLPISLTDDRAMTREVSPFDSVRTLQEYILELAVEYA
jgi:acyl carrier protein